MKSIKLSHTTKNMIKEMDGTYDRAVNNLIDEVEDYMPFIEEIDNSKVVINLKEDTVKRLNKYRLSTGESSENIIIRMMILSQVLNSNDE